MAVRFVALVAGIVLPLALLAAACSGDDVPALPQTPTAKVTIEGGGKSATLTVEIAATEAQREQGLMLRQEMDEDRGMLFLFAADTSIGFWMKNTYVPLDIAYIAADGTVLDVHAARPLDETLIKPAGPYRYTIEANEGWFARHGLGPGANVRLPGNLPVAE